MGTISSNTNTLVDAAHAHSELIQAMRKNKLSERFALEKKALKEEVHKAIDAGIAKKIVMDQMPKLPNPKDPKKDRFVAKISRYYKKHEAQKGQTADLKAIAAAANQLKKTYDNDIDAGNNIATEDKPKKYSDYRTAKENYKKAAKEVPLKGMKQDQLLALQDILSNQKLDQKTVQKLKTFHTKFNRVKTPEPKSSCNKMAMAMVALGAALAVSVLIKVNM